MDGRTDGRTEGGDYNIPLAFLKKCGDKIGIFCIFFRGKIVISFNHHPLYHSEQITRTITD